MNNFTDAFDDRTTSKLADDLGPTWDFFAASITPENVIRFNAAYNLVSGWEFTANNDVSLTDTLLADSETTEADESTLGLVLQHILVDESLSISDQTAEFRRVLLEHIMDQLAKIGIKLNMDYVDANSFDLIFDQYDLIFTLNGYEDLQGISETLELEDIPNVEKWMELNRLINGYDVNQIEQLYYLIEDVSTHLLETIRTSLVSFDLTPDTPEWCITRVRKHRAFLLNDTLAGKHVKGNGVIGMSMVSLRSFYQTELSAIRESLPMDYINQIIAFTLVSELKDDQIGIYIADFLKAECDHIDYYYRAEQTLANLGIRVTEED